MLTSDSLMRAKNTIFRLFSADQSLMDHFGPLILELFIPVEPFTEMLKNCSEGKMLELKAYLSHLIFRRPITRMSDRRKFSANSSRNLQPKNERGFGWSIFIRYQFVDQRINLHVTRWRSAFQII